MTAPVVAPAKAGLAPRRLALDLGAVALLLAVGIVGWWPSFGGPSFLPAVIGGTLLGIGVAVLCAWRRWGILIGLGLTVAAYVVFGGALALPHTAIAGFVPTLDTLRQLVIGAVTSWKQLVTTVAPLAVADGHLLAPFLLSLVAAVLTASCALRLRRPAWALLPAAAQLMLVIALGVPAPAAPVVQGVVFALVTAAWLALRQLDAGGEAAVAVGEADPGRARAMRRRRVVAGAVVLAVAGGAGAAAAAVVVPYEPRHVLRDVVIPPFDVHQYASPLQSYRGYVKDHRTDALFTVKGLPEGARIRLGTMDEYTGVVYDVSDRGVGSSGAFTPLRDNMSSDAQGRPATVRISIAAYSGVWVPDVGEVHRIRYEGDDAETLRRGSFYNESTGTAVATTRLHKGDAYTVDATIPTAYTDEQLADLAFGRVPLPKQSEVPDRISSLAAETVADAKTPIEQVRALETFFAEGGFFSHGLDGEVLSRAGHTTERISTLLAGEQMVGDDEQYAVAMALMARELGIPARVVMGFYPEKDQAAKGDFTANGDSLHAWVEVNFEKAGWVAFDPTPPKDKVPNDQSTKPKVNPKPQVLQPPPPPQEPADLPPTLPDQRQGDEGNSGILGIIGLILAIGGGSLLVLAILAAPFIVIGVWKAAKRRRRRAAAQPADRISGGWDELTDRAIDYGARLPQGATRAEEAVTVAESLTIPAVTALADRADAQVFGPADPSPAEVDAFWAEVDDIVGGLHKGAGWRRRLLARLNLRSLLDGTRLSALVGGLRTAATERIRRGPDATAAGSGTVQSSGSGAVDDTTRPESETR